MQSPNTKKSLLSLALLGLGLFSGAGVASAEVTGNIGVVSDYLFRGISQNVGRSPAVQGGLTYTHASGISLGYWGSNVNYGTPASTDSNNDGVQDLFGYGGGLENDLILSYGAKVGEFGYGIGVLSYFYTGDPAIDDNNTTELNGKLSYGPLTLNVFYALKDASWISQGDIYTNLAGSFPLPSDFTLNANAGMYFLNKDDTKYISGRTKSSVFTDATLGLSHPLPVKGSSMSVNYTFGGETSLGTDLENNTWLGLNLAF